MNYCLDSAVECVEKWNERTKRLKESKMTVWQMTDNEYFVQLLIKIIGISIIVIIVVIGYFYEKKK